MTIKSKISSSFWVGNQNFTPSFQERFNEPLRSLKRLKLVFTVCLIRIHYLPLFVYNYL